MITRLQQSILEALSRLPSKPTINQLAESLRGYQRFAINEALKDMRAKKLLALDYNEGQTPVLRMNLNAHAALEKARRFRPSLDLKLAPRKPPSKPLSSAGKVNFSDLVKRLGHPLEEGHALPQSDHGIKVQVPNRT